MYAMKTLIYACFLPGSTSPDYIGSHKAEPPARNCALRWRYAHGRYMGAGCWLFPAPAGLQAPKTCLDRSPWAQKLASMSHEELVSVRIDTLTEVDSGERWTAEADAIRRHQPPYNVMSRMSKEQRRANFNAYMRQYTKAYLAANPDKAEAKRAKDRERQRARRAKAKQAVA